jgi:hypothetical protein
MDNGTAKDIGQIILGGWIAVLTAWLKFKPNGNGNGKAIKNAIDDHRLNCEVKPIVTDIRITLAELKTNSANISKKQEEMHESVLELIRTINK